MTPELGHYALALALVLALVQSTVPLWGALRRDAALMAVAPATAIVQFLFVALAFAVLVDAHVGLDFSVATVVQNTHSTQPVLYRVTGAWGNHEGSMLLWILILTLFGALVGLFGRGLPDALRAATLAVQAWVAAAFLLFVLVASNPFQRLDPAPPEGRELNPVLQDIGLAIHPPLLYLGYVGFSIVYAFALGALITGRLDAAWARWVRPWTLLAWTFLTLGIAMGSYWAYYELGWGGYWFWDPVENASLIPWLAGTALLHSAVVVEKREALKLWTVFLAILTFSLSLLGTFLVRSGVITSVHSFAADPLRGVFILGILAVFVGGGLALFAWRAPALRAGGLFAPVSREGALVLNNLFLTSAAATVLVGTLYPLALEAVTGARISVGPPYFVATFGPLMAPLLVAMPFGPFLAWKRGDIAGVAQRLSAAFAVALTVMAGMLWHQTGGPVLAVAGIGLAVFVIVGAISETLWRARMFDRRADDRWRRLAHLPRASFGMLLGHVGVGVALLGIVSSSAFEGEQIASLRAGGRIAIAGYELVLDGVEARQGPNYREIAARFTVRSGGVVAASTESAKRTYPAANIPTTEAGLVTFGLSQLYVSLGEIEPDGAIGVRTQYKPLVLLVWLGAVVMALGGLLSLTDRRLRVGAPRRSRAAAGLRPLAPAE